MLAAYPPRFTRRIESGSLSCRITVCGFGASTLWTGEMLNALGEPLSARQRSSVNFTSADVSGLPDAKRTPCLSVKVYVLPSGETVHLSARPGFTVLS